MKAKIKKGEILLIMFCVLLPLFLILFSYKITLFFTDLSPNQENTINFLNDKEDLSLDYTKKEYSHLLDVKKIRSYLDYGFYSLLLILTLILTYYKRDKEKIKKLLEYGGITTILVVLLIIISMLLSFNTSFTIFHKIFFPQGNWIFSMDSLLIQTFPLDFFISIGRNILLLAFVFGSIFILLSLYLKHVSNKKA